jgi:hypothetical protein
MLSRGGGPALVLVLAGAAAASDMFGSDELLLTEVATVPTKGASGFAHFTIGGRDYLAVSHFFTSSPKREPTMRTESVVYTITGSSSDLRFKEVQRFPTVGAKGVVHIEHRGHHYLSVPNYSGGDTLVLRWNGKRFTEMQRLASKGGSSVTAFKLGESQVLGVVEFNKDAGALYYLRGEYPDEQFVSWTLAIAPGVTAMTTALVPAESYTGEETHLMLLTASYVSRLGGWTTPSHVFALNDECVPENLMKTCALPRHHELKTARQLQHSSGRPACSWLWLRLVAPRARAAPTATVWLVTLAQQCEPASCKPIRSARTA